MLELRFQLTLVLAGRADRQLEVDVRLPGLALDDVAEGLFQNRVEVVTHLVEHAAAEVDFGTVFFTHIANSPLFRFCI